MVPLSSALVVTIVYGLLSALGGIYGYIKAKSQVSLISGLVSGALLFASGVLQFLGFGWGRWLALALTIVLVITFGVRLQKTGKWMPAGVMVALGVATSIILVAG
ncbi:MAG: TMEM14 family protein [Prochlorothrix sp.]|nr:TMEM14 family protein [Prochlorothrix sp.]